MLRLVAVLIAMAQPVLAQNFDDLIDYQSLDHRVELTHFRAGNHDESGVNEYYFTGSLHALAVLKEERKKEFEDRKKVSREIGEFGDLQLKTLAFWQQTPPIPQLEISGEDIRQLASEAMRSFEILETQVAILVRIQLHERSKQFMVLGEDTAIGFASYYVIPESLPHKPLLENSVIEITDALGTHVKLMSKYSLLNSKKNRKK